MIESLTKALPPSVMRLLNRQPGLQKIIANAGWLFADNVAVILSSLFVGAWVARYLGPTRYGIFNYALAIYALFEPVVVLGLKDIVIRDIVRSPEEKDEILGTTFVLQFIGSLLALGLAISVAQITRADDALTRWLIAILAGQFVFQAFNITLDYWFQAQVQVRFTVWARNIGLLLIAFVKISLILFRAPLIAFAWAALGQIFVFTIALAAFHHFSGQILSAWRFSLSRARKLIGNSWPLFISALAITVYGRIGQVMLGNMVSADELGLYSAAIRLSEAWYFIPMAIGVSVFPAVVRSREKDSDEVHRKRMQLFYDVMAGIGYVIVIPLALLAPVLIRVLFGSYYAESGFILRVHAWVLLFTFLGVSRSRWLVAEDLIRFNMLATLLGALTAIMMNFILIPKFGGLGAAWAVVISQIISTYLSSLLSRSTRAVFKQQSLALLVPFRVFSLRRSLINDLLQESL